MLGHEDEEGGKIAAVGGHRVRRCPPLVDEPALPARDGARERRLFHNEGKRSGRVFKSGRLSHPRMTCARTRERKQRSSVAWPGWNLSAWRVPNANSAGGDAAHGRAACGERVW